MKQLKTMVALFFGLSLIGILQQCGQTEAPLKDKKVEATKQPEKPTLVPKKDKSESTGEANDQGKTEENNQAEEKVAMTETHKNAPSVGGEKTITEPADGVKDPVYEATEVTVVEHATAEASTANAPWKWTPYPEVASLYLESETTMETLNPAVDISIQGIKKRYIADGGLKEFTHTTESKKMTFKMGDLPATDEVSETMVLSLDGWIYSWDPKTLVGSKFKNPTWNMFAKLSEEEAQKMAEGLARATNTKITPMGTETIDGKTCELVKATTQMGPMHVESNTCTWKNLQLKMSSNSDQTNTTEIAVKVDENPADFSAKFVVPTNVTFTLVNLNQ